jgi:hypothetical protein
MPWPILEHLGQIALKEVRLTLRDRRWISLMRLKLEKCPEQPI